MTDTKALKEVYEVQTKNSTYVVWRDEFNQFWIHATKYKNFAGVASNFSAPTLLDMIFPYPPEVGYSFMFIKGYDHCTTTKVQRIDPLTAGDVL